ncbi:MAG: GNAT family N-acetyltransferase [Pseudomonadota bacterium]
MTPNIRELAVRRIDVLTHELLSIIRKYSHEVNVGICDDRDVEASLKDFLAFEGNTLVVAQLGRKTVGFGTVSTHFSTALLCRVAYINDIFVLPEYRDLKIGTKIYRFIHDQSQMDKQLKWMRWLVDEKKPRRHETI